MRRLVVISLSIIKRLMFGLLVSLAGWPTHAETISDEQVSQAYIYLLGRLYITRQQQLDFEEGFKWNEFVHRKPGAVDWPNPNLDVAYSEAWVAVDETSCSIVSVPEVKGRYYVVQILNGWG